MTDKELRKLSRADLLEMLIEQSEQLEEMKQRCEQAEKALERRELSVHNAGSIAEAALQLNGIFDVAQAAAQQYLESVEVLAKKQEAICAQRQQECLEESTRLMEETQARCEKMESEAKVRCAEMVAKAKMESTDYWTEVSDKLEAFYDSHTGLRELLSIVTSKTVKA